MTERWFEGRTTVLVPGGRGGKLQRKSACPILINKLYVPQGRRATGTCGFARQQRYDIVAHGEMTPEVLQFSAVHLAEHHATVRASLPR
jgi:hypothetical protein